MVVINIGLYLFLWNKNGVESYFLKMIDMLNKVVFDININLR